MPAVRRPPPQLPPVPLPGADVILDVDAADGLLHLVLANIGAAPAHAVRVRFSRVLRDVAGLRLNDNPLFTQLEFLAPARHVRLFVDTLSGHAQRRQPMAFTVRLAWRDDAGHGHHRTITHDLAAWTRLRTTV